MLDGGLAGSATWLALGISIGYALYAYLHDLPLLGAAGSFTTCDGRQVGHC